MAIEFRCPQCNQLLRVSDASAGKNARCPKCRKLVTVPAAAPASVVLPPFPTAPPPPSAAAPEPPPPPIVPAPPTDPNDPFAFLGGRPTAAAPSPTAAGPFGEQGVLVVSSSPSRVAAASKPGRGQIGNVQVSFDSVMGHAWRVWQRNLGLLVGATLLTMVVGWAVSIPFALLQLALVNNDAPEAAMIASLLGLVAMVVTQIYLGIGQTQISLKLARGNRAKIGDLFGGGKLVLPVMGAGLIASLAYGVAGTLCFILGILLLLWFWPFYFLIVDEKSSAMDSFSRAAKITERNRGTAFVMWLASIGIVLAGFVALCIGAIVAMPLVSLLWATAYLMMSGQLEAPGRRS